jgi:hypothetical protein
MNVLWFAFGIYILGISVVVWTRPSLMFQGGTWKEFGLSQKGNSTIFPFWMFVVLWSIVSYIVGTLCVIGFAGVASNANAATAAATAAATNANAAAATAAAATAASNAASNAANATNATAATATAAAASNAPTVSTAATVVPEEPLATASLPAPPHEVATSYGEVLPPPHRRRRARKPVKGYYVRGLVKGKPTYVYYGPESPFDEDT